MCECVVEKSLCSELCHCVEQFVSLFGFAVDDELKRLCKVKAENTHDGLCVDNISAGYQVEISIKFCQIIDEGLALKKLEQFKEESNK